MRSFVALPDFYKTLNQTPEPAQTAIGHFNVFKIDDLLLPQRKPVTYSRRSFFKVSLVNGHSKIHYADQTIEVKGSVLVFTNPMVPFHWETISKVQTGFVAVFTEDFFSRFGSIKDYPVFQSANAAVIPLAENELPQYIELFTKMYQELQGHYVYKYDLIRNLLMEVVHEAQKMQPAAGTSLTGANAAERIASLFAELLERQFPIDLSNPVMQFNHPSAFASQLNIHVNHLNKALKEVTGQTTSQRIKMRVLQEAKTLLKSTTWTVNEIAWSLGFIEPNHFSSFFKTNAGMTPNHFRKGMID